MWRRFTSVVSTLVLINGCAVSPDPATDSDEQVAQMSETVSVSFVVDRASRNPAGVAEIQSILKSLGAVSTRAGYATVSCRFTPEQFQDLFHVDVKPVPAAEPGEADFGSSGGYVTTGTLSVPPELSDYVTSASVEPPAKRYTE